MSRLLCAALLVSACAPETIIGPRGGQPDFSVLEQRGLIVSGPRETGPDQGAYAVMKPTSIAGNVRPHEPWVYTHAGTGVECNGPVLWLMPSDCGWLLKVRERDPPGHGDFEKCVSNKAEAERFALEYYFGDPALMNPPE